MNKKENIRTEEITDKDILSLYEDVLPLVFKEQGINDSTNALKKWINRFVPFDYFHYGMDDIHIHPLNDKMRIAFDMWDVQDKNKKFSQISMIPVRSEDPDAAFDEMVKRNYHQAVADFKAIRAKDLVFHYHRIISREIPKIAVGFMRIRDTAKDNSITKTEIKIFDFLTPHILLAFRLILTLATQSSQTFKDFYAYADTCSKISHTYDLSGSEYKFMTELLFGYTNEQIAERNFVSLATVKKHIQHIFKKTGTKNRVDFIGKFFTSPERVEL